MSQKKQKRINKDFYGYIFENKTVIENVEHN